MHASCTAYSITYTYIEPDTAQYFQTNEPISCMYPIIGSNPVSDIQSKPDTDVVDDTPTRSTVQVIDNTNGEPYKEQGKYLYMYV